MGCDPTSGKRLKSSSPAKQETQTIGRSRGGLSTKIHATCDGLGNPTGFHLTPDQTHDLQGADVLLSQLKLEEVDALLADKAYDAQQRVLAVLEQAQCSMR